MHTSKFRLGRVFVHFLSASFFSGWIVASYTQHLRFSLWIVHRFLSNSSRHLEDSSSITISAQYASKGGWFNWINTSSRLQNEFSQLRYKLHSSIAASSNIFRGFYYPSSIFFYASRLTSSFIWNRESTCFFPLSIWNLTDKFGDDINSATNILFSPLQAQLVLFLTSNQICSSTLFHYLRRHRHQYRFDLILSQLSTNNANFNFFFSSPSRNV